MEVSTPMIHIVLSPNDDQQLLWWRPISFYWKEEPAGDILSVSYHVR